MKTLSYFYHKILLPACLICTILCFAFSVILHLSQSEMTLPMINMGNLTQIFVFSLVFAASFQLFSLGTIRFWAQLTLHFVAFLANISIVFFLIGKHYTTARNAFVVLFVFALIYIVIAVICVTVRHVILASRSSNNTYKRQF